MKGQPSEQETLSQAEFEQILLRRAALAAKPIQVEETGERIELALFRVGKELFGLDIHSIQDIHPCTSITRLPRAPKWIAGITNIGGHILAVLDLQSFFGLTPPELLPNKPASNFLIRLVNQDVELALLVDEVLSIESLSTSKVQETTDANRCLPIEYVSGVYHRTTPESPLVLILDLARLVKDPRLIIQEEIL